MLILMGHKFLNNSHAIWYGYLLSVKTKTFKVITERWNGLLLMNNYFADWGSFIIFSDLLIFCFKNSTFNFNPKDWNSNTCWTALQKVWPIIIFEIGLFIENRIVMKLLYYTLKRFLCAYDRSVVDVKSGFLSADRHQGLFTSVRQCISTDKLYLINTSAYLEFYFRWDQFNSP